MSDKPKNPRSAEQETEDSWQPSTVAPSSSTEDDKSKSRNRRNKPSSAPGAVSVNEAEDSRVSSKKRRDRHSGSRNRPSRTPNTKPSRGTAQEAKRLEDLDDAATSATPTSNASSVPGATSVDSSARSSNSREAAKSRRYDRERQEQKLRASGDGSKASKNHHHHSSAISKEDRKIQQNSVNQKIAKEQKKLRLADGDYSSNRDESDDDSGPELLFAGARSMSGANSHDNLKMPSVHEDELKTTQGTGGAAPKEDELVVAMAVDEDAEVEERKRKELEAMKPLPASTVPEPLSMDDPARNFGTLPTDHEAEDRKIAQQNERNLRRRRNIICVVICLVVCAVAGVVAWLFLGKKDEGTDRSLPTMAPVISTPTTPQPQGTAVPTATPTSIFKYRIPSYDDCLANRFGVDVTDQDKMRTSSFVLPFDVSLQQEEEIDSWLDGFANSVNTKFIPTLLGCDTVLSQQGGGATGGRRLVRAHRQLTTDIRYVIGNADAAGDYAPGQICEADAPVPCYRVNIILDLSLKGDEKTLDLFNLITSVLNGLEGGLVVFLGLSENFVSATVVGFTGTTDAPSSKPSSSPTFVPTQLPSSTPTTSEPSGLPSVAPSAATEAPSNSPTTAQPTATPTRSPTRRPTPNPTPNPTPPPTPGPTQLTPPPTPTDYFAVPNCASSGFGIKLYTDNFPAEISWALIDNNSGSAALISAGNYQNNLVYQASTCLNPSRTYTFIIYDSARDGICCSFGTGYYELFYNGPLIFRSTGSYGAEERVSVPEGIIIPSTASPTAAPSQSCMSGRLVLFTDDYPSETTIELRDDLNQVLARRQPSDLTGRTEYSIPFTCLRRTRTYTIEIQDTFGDGICCNYGSGYYFMEYNGNEIYRSSGNFGAGETVTFVDGTVLSRSLT